MRNNHLYLAITMLFITQLFGCRKENKSWLLDSPGQQVRIEILQQENASDGLLYSVHFKEDGKYKQILDPSPLGIDREDGKFTGNLDMVSEENELMVEDRYILTSGKKVQCSAVYNSLILNFKNQNMQEIALNFRAYDNGIAFRYQFKGKTKDSVQVVNEYTGFDFKNGNFWGHPYDTVSTYTPAYETYFEGPLDVGTSAPPNKNGWAFPVLVESEGMWMLVSEAGMDGSYGASHLQASCEDGRYMIRFAEEGEAEGYYENTSRASLPCNTPWRFMALGTSLHEIVETTLPTDLSSDSKVVNRDWIKPGRASWSWWSDNDSPQDYERMVPFLDFSATMGWEYFLVDANWNRMKNGTLEKLASYAKGKDVGLLLWYNSGGKHNVVTEEPRDRMENRKIRREEFARISKLGIKGVKVDFFQSDKQEIIKQYIQILEDAADFKLLVNFHGCTLPRGWRRTWPHLLSMEAVRGEECYIFDEQFPERAPGNMAILPFTRNAVGPVDYTPGGYSDHNYPHLTTFGFELALPVILESGIMHHADTPEQTLALPDDAVAFLKEIPVAWDDTKYLTGYPGKDVVIARKKDQRWYLGGINGEGFAKELTIDLSLTGTSPEKVELIVDGNGARNLQRKLMQTEDGKLTVHMLPYGGFAGFWE